MVNQSADFYTGQTQSIAEKKKEEEKASEDYYMGGLPVTLRTGETGYVTPTGEIITKPGFTPSGAPSSTGIETTLSGQPSSNMPLTPAVSISQVQQQILKGQVSEQQEQIQKQIESIKKSEPKSMFQVQQERIGNIRGRWVAGNTYAYTKEQLLNVLGRQKAGITTEALGIKEQLRKQGVSIEAQARAGLTPRVEPKVVMTSKTGFPKEETKLIPEKYVPKEEIGIYTKIGDKTKGEQKLRTAVATVEEVGKSIILPFITAKRTPDIIVSKQVQYKGTYAPEFTAYEKAKKEAKPTQIIEYYPELQREKGYMYEEVETPYGKTKVLSGIGGIRAITGGLLLAGVSALESKAYEYLGKKLESSGLIEPKYKETIEEVYYKKEVPSIESRTVFYDEVEKQKQLEETFRKITKGEPVSVRRTTYYEGAVKHKPDLTASYSTPLKYATPEAKKQLAEAEKIYARLEEKLKQPPSFKIEIKPKDLGSADDLMITESGKVVFQEPKITPKSMETKSGLFLEQPKVKVITETDLLKVKQKQVAGVITKLKKAVEEAEDLGLMQTTEVMKEATKTVRDTFYRDVSTVRQGVGFETIVKPKTVLTSKSIINLEKITRKGVPVLTSASSLSQLKATESSEAVASALRTREDVAVRTGTQTGTKLSSRTGVSTLQGLKSLQITRADTSTGTRTGVSTRTLTASSITGTTGLTETVKTTLVPREQPPTKPTKTTTTIRRRTPPKPPRRFKVPVIPPVLLPKKKTEKEPYLIERKEKGKFVKLGTASKIGEALAKGSEATRQVLERTFRVSKEGKPITAGAPAGYRSPFKKGVSKEGTGVYIEKSAIKSTREKSLLKSARETKSLLKKSLK